MFKKDKNDYSEDVILRERTFPKRNTVIIIFLVIIQVALIGFAVLYEDKPKDIIDSYEITATPNSDGTVDLEYSFVWTPVDKFEDLTWVEIGLANYEYEIYQESCSENISLTFDSLYPYDYSGVRLFFDRAYSSGETLAFSFKIRQSAILCEDDGGMFYSFIPGWFNSTPVKSYTFRWKSDDVTSANTDTIENGYYVWKGEMNCGEYVEMNIGYPKNHFENADVVDYFPFNPSGVYNDLGVGKTIVAVICVIAVLLLVIAELFIIDSFISYNRGRGFMGGYGYPMHIYGRTNALYIREKRAYRSTLPYNSGYHGGGGGGCACACACACAGGGRAGCSQKDTFSSTEQNEYQP